MEISCAWLRFKRPLAVFIFVACLPFFGHGQDVCASLFDGAKNRPSLTEFSQLSEADFINELQTLLTPPPAPEFIAKARNQAEQDVQSLEQHLGGQRIPEPQRSQSLFQALRVRSSDNYLMLVNGPESANLSRGWAVDAHVKQETPEQAFYGKIFKVPLIDFWYEQSLAGHSLAKLEIDGEKIYSFYIGRAPREWNQYQNTKSTARLLVRDPNHLTVIERYAQENKIAIPLFQDVVDQAQKQGRPVFEIGRISNMTTNRTVVLAHRLLMSYYLFRNQPNAVIVLSTSSRKLVEYYKKWGFTNIETISHGTENEFHLMAIDAKHFIEMTLNDFKTSTP